MNGIDPRTTRDVETLLSRHETEPEHPRHVCRLALQMLGQPGPWHPLHPGEREEVAIAALLHDIGWSVSGAEGRGHHKASARLIREHPWDSLPPDAILRVAALARYHRKALPTPGHTEHDALPETDRIRVLRLAAIVRVADGFDRRHLQCVRHIRVEHGSGTLRLTACSTRVAEAEVAAADKKSDLLRALHGILVRVDSTPDTGSDTPS